MAFWRQSGSDSLSDKLVRPRGDKSGYWERKPKLSSKLVQPVTSRGSEAVDLRYQEEETETQTSPSQEETSAREAAAAREEAEKLFTPPLAAPPSATDIPGMKDEDNEDDEDDEDLAELDVPEAPPTVSFDDDDNDDDEEDGNPFAPPPEFSMGGLSDVDEDEVEDDTSEDSSSLVPPPPSLDLPDEFSDDEDETLFEPEVIAEEEAEVDDTSSKVIAFPPSERRIEPEAAGNETAKEADEEADSLDVVEDDDALFEEADAKEPEAIALEPVEEAELAAPPEPIDADVIESDDEALSEQEKMAVSLAASSPDHSQSSSDSTFIRPQSERRIVTPRRTGATYYDEERDSEDDDDGYYVPAPSRDDSGGRRMALYLAGAASISAICAAVYFMLPNGGQSSDVTTASNTTPSDLTNNATSTASVSSDTTELAEVPPSPDQNLSTAAPVETEPEGALSVTGEELFAENETTTATETTTEPVAERTVTPSETTLATPDNKPPEQAPIIREKAPDLTLSAPAKALVKTAPVVESAPTETVSVTPPKSAPSIASQVATPSEPTVVSARNINLPPRVSDAAVREGSLAQQVIDSLAAQGVYVPSGEQQQFAYNIRNTTRITPEGETGIVVTPSGARANFQFGETRNEVRPTFVARSASVSALPAYMLMSEEWISLPSATALQDAPNGTTAQVIDELPAQAVLAKMGSVTDSNGDRWAMIGQDGIVIGYVAEDATAPVGGLGANQSQVAYGVPYRAQITNTVFEQIDVSAPCRDMTISVGGISTGGVACATPDGDWMMKDDGRFDAFADVSKAVITSPQPDTNQLSAEVQQILFEPETLRRDARHGLGSSSNRISSLFTAASGQTLAIQTPMGESGVITFAGQEIADDQLIGGPESETPSTVSDLASSPTESPCNSAAFEAGEYVGELQACLNSDGQWTAKVLPKGPGYKLRAFANLRRG